MRSELSLSFSSKVFHSLALTALALAALLFLPGLFSTPLQPVLLGDNAPPTFDSDHFESLNLSRSIIYTRRDILVVPTKNEGLFPQHIDSPLMLGSQLLSQDVEHGSVIVKESLAREQPPIFLPVPMATQKPDASHLLFGLATDIERLAGSLLAISHWAGGTRCRLVAVVLPSHPEKLTDVFHKALRLGIELEIEESDQEYNERYFSLVKILHTRSHKHQQWAAIIDDDTFFPSMSALLSELSKHDSASSAYVGGLSEDLIQMAGWGYMAFGGAGIFLSMPLLAQLVEPSIFDACNAIKWTGDRRIAQCIYRHTLTKMTVVPGLHQLDLHGDMSGFYEAEGREQPLSVHHWKSWFHHDMAKMAVVSRICGDACLLHRWKFADDWVLVNGFSLLKHGAGYDGGGFAMEKTWDDVGQSTEDAFSHSLAPLRERDGDKVSFRMVEAFEDIDGSVRQIYVKRGVSEQDNDSVFDLVWRLDGHN